MPEKDDSMQKIDYTVDYRDIKFPRLEFKTGNLHLILPKDYEKENTILEKHQEWITKKEQLIKQALIMAEDTTLNLERSVNDLKNLVYSTIQTYKKEAHLQVNQVYFRKMRTKWASFSTKRNLTINTLLKYLPEQLIKYVIFHEMVHSIERKHNERFWNLINEKFKDVETKENDLLIHWFLVQRMTSS